MCYTIIPYYEQNNNGSKFVQSPCVAILMNLYHIVEDDGETILLSHTNFINYLHLFGSALHVVFGKNEYCRLSGNNIESDLKECWPYVFEKWGWEKDILVQFAHWKTEEKISDELAEKIIHIKNLRNGFNYKEKILSVRFEITINSCAEFINELKCIFTNNSITETGFKNATVLLKDIYYIVFKKVFASKKINISKYSLKSFKKTFPLTHDYNFLSQTNTSFCDIWSKIFADDIYFKRFKNDPFSQDASMEFRKLVLEVGWAITNKEQIKKFLGKDVELESFYINNFFVIRDLLELDNDSNKNIKNNKVEKTIQICNEV